MRQARMTNSNNDIEELEELLTELEGQEAQIVTPYSEEDDAVTRLMDAPLGDQDWMVQVTALDRRMMSTSQLLSELQAGKVSSRTLVWRGGMDDWLPVSRVDELSLASPSPAAGLSRHSVPPPAQRNSSPRAAYPSAAPPPAPPQASQPAWSSPPSAPLPPPPSAMSPPFGMAPGVGLPPPPMALQPPPPPPIVPPPAPPAASYGLPGPVPVSTSLSEPPMSHGNTTRPVAVDFSDMMPENDPPLQSKRWVMALSAVAILAVFVTVYSLSSGGGESDAKEAAAAAQPQAVSALQPAPAKAKEAPVTSAPAPTAPKADSPVAAASAEASEDEAEVERESDDSKASSASARQTAQARYTPRSEYRRRSRGSSSEARERSDEPEPAAAVEAPSSTARAADEQEAPSEPAVAAADEVDEAPKSSGKSTNTFNRDAAKAVLDEAAAQAKNCRPQGGPSGTGRVQVRYEPSGKVANVAILTSKFDNTTTGSCVRMLFRRAKVPEFTGAPVMVVNKSFEIP